MSIILKNGQRLQLYSSNNQPIQVVASYSDITGTNISGSFQTTQFTGPGTFDVISSPGTDATRSVKHLNIKNIGAKPAFLTASHSSSSGLYTVYSAFLESSGNLEWQDSAGWTKSGKDGSQEMTTWDSNFVQITTYSVSGTYTWTKPTNPTPNFVYVLAWGGGGGGGAGGSGPNGGNSEGGAGGGGGAHERGLFRASDLSSTVTVTVGSGGLGGTGVTFGGTAGKPGQTTSFGSYLKAYGGGGGGCAADNASGTWVGGGGGGGSGEEGGAGTNLVGGVGGGPGTAATTTMGGKGATGPAAGTLTHAEFGGAGGGVTNITTQISGSKSIWGGGGGGCGGNRTGSVLISGSFGGKPNGEFVTHGGGGAPGRTGQSGGVGFTAPDADASGGPLGLYGGLGGGGGGVGGASGEAPLTGGTGGLGGRRGGGGGGGGAGTSTSGGKGGTGGQGGSGEVIIISWV